MHHHRQQTFITDHHHHHHEGRLLAVESVLTRSWTVERMQCVSVDAEDDEDNTHTSHTRVTYVHAFLGTCTCVWHARSVGAC